MFKSFFNSRENLLYFLTIAIPFSVITWSALLNNFAVEMAQFDGKKIGILQSVREIPGLLAFSIVFVLLIFKQQTAAYLSLFLLGFGTLLTGFFPSALGLYTTTLIMSIGFHYLETLQNSLSLQWVPKKNTPSFLGKLSSVRAFTCLAILGVLYTFMEFLHISYEVIYALFGGITMVLSLVAWKSFELFKEDVVQERKLFLRKEYWLFYALTFLAGARRQIVVVFAGFLLLEKFGFSAKEIVLLFSFNNLINMFCTPCVSKLIERLA